MQYKRLIDISQPVRADTAAFPGDTAFSRNIVLSCKEGGVVNLSSFTMSPHVGTHVDAPGHIKGDMSVASELAGKLPLDSFIGETLLLDLAPFRQGISWSLVSARLSELKLLEKNLPEKILFKTQNKIRYEIFEDEYAFFETDLVRELAQRGVKLMGIDAPSADHIRSKTLDAHHELDRYGMTWLENLDLCQVEGGVYFLIAFPIKFMELEASPVRAVLLEF